jgi:hypothetical protein
MSTVGELEKAALGLPESDRVLLAAHLLQSLPPLLVDEDEGLSEAIRRDLEWERDPSLGMSLEEFEGQMQKNRSR